MSDKNEIVLYQPDEAIKLEVRLEGETVWLTQQQMAELFETTRNNVTLHIGNIFKEHELDKDSVCKESLLTATDGKKYKTKFYNLDVIISVGYRVKSLRGTQFRQWANRVLKDYLLKGYSVNNRIERLEQRVTETENKIDFFVRTSLPPVEGIFFDGQMLEPFTFVNNLIRSARKRIVLIDNYIDDSVLLRLAERANNVSATIYTQQVSPSFAVALERHNAEFSPIEVHRFTKSHDRFLIIDSDVYHIGASIKDLGKKWFAFCKMQLQVNDILHKLES
jgi:hypothetical protein